MLLELSADQEFFRETTVKFLNGQVPVDRLRGLRDDPAGFDPEYWRRGAELGWTSLLVSEEAGGGNLSGNPVTDLAVLAYEFGRHAAPGPLVAVNLVTAALAETGAHPDVLAELLAGTAVATWCHAEPAPHDGFEDVEFSIRAEGDEFVLSGVKRPVESAGQAHYLLVTGRTGEGLTQVLVPADTAGISISPLTSIDLTRRFATVRFDDVRVPADAVVGVPGEAGEQVRRQRRVALAVASAETVGAMQRGFDMTVQWAKERYSFGRPLASYQAVKHRFADLLTALEGSHAVSTSAVAAVDANAGNADELLAVAKSYTGDQGGELLHDCVQLHGGMGLTFEHDLHLYLRRATVNRALFGTPAEHRRRIARRLAAQRNSNRADQHTATSEDATSEDKS